MSVVLFVTSLGSSYGWHVYVCRSTASSFHPLVFWSLYTAHVSHSCFNFSNKKIKLFIQLFSFLVGLLLLREFVFRKSPDKSWNNLFLHCRHSTISDSTFFDQCRHFGGVRFETVHNRYLQQKNIFQPPVTRFPCAGIAGQWSVWWTSSVVCNYRWLPDSAISHSLQCMLLTGREKSWPSCLTSCHFECCLLLDAVMSHIVTLSFFACAGRLFCISLWL